jgi:hypothetical protein
VNGTIDWMSLAYLMAFIGGSGAFLITAVALVRRSERRLGAGRPTPHPPAPPGTGGEDQISAYLDRMGAELALPAADVAEVRAELADHLQDSIASLEAEGLDREGAIREALGRLGPAAELGRQIRSAHQSTRRLLAGVGGGVFAAGGGFVLGYLGGGMLAFLLALAFAAITTALTSIGIQLPDLAAGDHTGNTVNSLLLAIAGAIAAGAATRYAVRTSASLSRHTPRSVAVFWAVAGALAFGWWALFGMRGPQSWPGIAAELCIPVAAIAGALVRIERPMPHVGRWAVIVAALSVVVISLGLVASSGLSVSGSGSQEAESIPMPDLHLDAVAPMAPAAWLPEDGGFGGGYGSESASSGTRLWVDVGSDLPAPAIATVLANWRDMRFEAWHAPAGDGPGSIGIDPHYTNPIEVQPAVLHGSSLEAVFHFERLRDARSWWVVLTAVGPDGHRYRLHDGMGGDAIFNGSAWDWLTAPQ